MKEKGRYLLWYWGPVTAVCLAIFIQSSYRSPAIIPDVDHLDKVLHLSAYAVLAALFLRAYQPMRCFDSRPAALLLVSILSATLYGLSDEIHQAYVSVRQADIHDWFADAAGSVLGAVLYAKTAAFVARRRLPH